MQNPLAETSLLISLSITQWQGFVSQPKALEAVREKFDADTDGDIYRKALLPGQPLKKIKSTANKIRRHFYANTFAWLDNTQSGGGRLIPAVNFHDFIHEHAELKNEFYTEVESFLSKFPELVSKAKFGSLVQASQVPSADVLRECFCITLLTIPFPSASDFRIEAPREQIEDLQQKIERSVTHIQGVVLDDVRSRLVESLEGVRDVLVQERNFRSTSAKKVSKVTEVALKLVEALPEDFADIVQRAHEEFNYLYPEDVRNDPAVRAQLLEKTNDFLEELN